MNKVKQNVVNLAVSFLSHRQVSDAPVSWCKVEVGVQSPKSITRLLAEEVVATAPEDRPSSPAAGTPTPSNTSTSPTKAAKAGKLPPAPPVVTMSLSMKTVVSPRTHTHEVVALSVLVHREVRLDGASDEDGKKVMMRGLRGGVREFPAVFEAVKKWRDGRREVP